MRKCIFAFLFVFPLIAFAQSKDTTLQKSAKNYALSAMYQNGYVFPTNDFVRGDNAEKELINSFQTFSLRFAKQSFGEEEWEQFYKYPQWGIGLSVYDFHNPDEIGNPIALYGFIDAPFERWNRLSLNYEFGFGATFNWKKFDPITNNSNIAIGAQESFYIDVGLNLQYNFMEHFDITTGFSLTHFSNGALKKPNKGLNMIAPKITAKYNFYDNSDFTENKISQYKIKEHKPKQEWLVSGFLGATNVIFDSVNVNIREKYEGITYLVAGITTTYNWHLWRMSKLGVGMAITYNGSVNAQAAVENNELEDVDGLVTDKLQVSVYPSYEFVIHKLSLIFQPSFYIYRKKLEIQSPVFHQRIGFKYYFSDKLFAGITLRAYKFYISDFVEWNLGYKIN